MWVGLWFGKTLSTGIKAPSQLAGPVLQDLQELVQDPQPLLEMTKISSIRISHPLLYGYASSYQVLYGTGKKHKCQHLLTPVDKLHFALP